MASEQVLAKMAVLISANTAEFNKALERSQNQFSSFTNNISRLAGSIGIAFGAFQVFNVLRGAINSIAEFEQELSTVRAITGATGDEFESLKKSALDLGGSTRYTAKQVAELQVAYGRLGFTTPEILAASKATLDLATATGEDLAKSADVAGSTLRAFRLSATETGRVVDVMAGAFNMTALGLENFSEAMKYVAPIAAANNISLEETTALLGVLADNGIRGSMAGTSLRKIMSDLKGESGTLSEKLAKLAAKGLSSADAMDEVGRTAYASLIILADNTKRTEDLTGALKNVAGAGAEAARIMGDNLIGDVTKLSSAYDGLVQSAGGSTSVLREFVHAGTAVLNALNTQNGALGGYVANWLKLALIVPRTAAKIISAAGELIAGTDRLTLAQVNEELKVINDLRNKAKLEGNEKDVQIFTKAIAELTSKYGLLRDKAVEFKEEAKAGTDTANTLGLIQQLEEQIKKLEEAKKAAFSVKEIEQLNVRLEDLRLQLEVLNATRPLSDFGQKQLSNALAGLQTDVKKLFESVPESLNQAKLPVAELIVDLEALNKAYEKSGQKIADWATAAGIAADEYEKTLIDLTPIIHSALSGIGEAFGNAISGASSFGDSLLRVLAGILVQLGEMLITAGLGVEAFKASLENLNGYLAIAAGVALIALGTAISGSIKGLGSSGGGGRSGSGIASTSSTNTARNINDQGAVVSIMPAGEWRIEGRDLVFIYDKNKVIDSRRKVGG